MKACIIAVGSEMLTPFRVDTNSLVITGRLNEIGIDVRLKAAVGDDVDELAHVFEGALAWADLIVVTGGLGPTEDDITRDAVARVLDAPIDVDESIVDRLRVRFAPRPWVQTRRHGDRAAARAAARDEADAGIGDRGAAGAADRRQRSVSPRA